MNDLPDYLPGNPEMYGIKQQAQQYYQGVDINIKTCLLEDNIQVCYDDYSLKAVLKKDLSDVCPIWVGHENYGVFKDDEEAIIRIPQTITVQIPSGIYYIAIEGITKKEPRHRAVLFTKTISIVPSAASPNPFPETIIVEIPDPTIPTSSSEVTISYF